MKKLGKITINPEKMIKNEELVNLRGGYGGDGNCGPGYLEYICNVTPCDGCVEQTGLIACVETTQEIVDYVEDWWPNYSNYNCTLQ